MRLVVFGTLFAMGCGAEPSTPPATANPAHVAEAAPAEATPAEAPKAALTELTEAQVAALAAGDAADGATDKVVHQCNSCALQMEGDAVYFSKAGDYELHFCSASCLDAHNADPAAGLEAMAENAKKM